MRAHIRIVLIGLIGVLVWSAPAHAQMLNEAVEAWLADDDETALPLLGALANLGDAEAQLFLGQIERVAPPGADSPFVRSLSTAASGSRSCGRPRACPAPPGR